MEAIEFKGEQANITSKTNKEKKPRKPRKKKEAVTEAGKGSVRPRISVKRDENGRCVMKVSTKREEWVNNAVKQSERVGRNPKFSYNREFVKKKSVEYTPQISQEFHQIIH